MQGHRVLLHAPSAWICFGGAICLWAARGSAPGGQVLLPRATPCPPRHCSAQIDCEVPLEEAFALWEDRERIPQWMPWITSVVVQQARPGRGHGGPAGAVVHGSMPPG